MALGQEDDLRTLLASADRFQESLEQRGRLARDETSTDHQNVAPSRWVIALGGQEPTAAARLHLKDALKAERHVGEEAYAGDNGHDYKDPRENGGGRIVAIPDLQRHTRLHLVSLTML